MEPFLQIIVGCRALPFVGGWMADRLLGDPVSLPHPVVGFGKLISMGEKRLNRGSHRVWKGAFLAVGLIIGIYLFVAALLTLTAKWPVVRGLLIGIGVFYCLAGRTLIREVKAVFVAVDQSLEAGRTQVGRIVGRDTSALSAQEIRTAALETLAENLSDGVIAPMFWFLLLGLPGMMAYKMVNTLDSMIGYKNDRYLEFGRVAARIDDAANYLPARLTALLMLLGVGRLRLLGFVRRYGRAHASPNSGYPEAALAAILDCRFGGTHDYFGKPVVKPYIGTHDRPLTTDDMQRAVLVNQMAELLMGGLVCVILLVIHYYIYA